jgi:hypothetical protein
VISLRRAVGGILKSNQLGRDWLELKRRERRQRDWSTIHKQSFGTTELSICTTIGMGDVMVAKQVCQEFLHYCERHGDPKLGRIVITGGAWPLEFMLPRGDHNIYWWWSMNGKEDWLDRYLNRVNVKPDAVACLSSWCLTQAKGAGCKTIYLPLAAGSRFAALGLQRAGIGYGGSKGHKDTAQVATVVGPFTSDPEFEWASGFTRPEEINEFYNRKRIVLGMTEKYQEWAGMVNNRVFEVLASGTPFLIHTHRAIEEVLGPYPYQTASAERSRELADEILADYDRHLAVFDGYRKMVEEKHRYQHRLKTLIDFLGDKN